MTCRCRHYRKLFIAAPLLFLLSGTLIYTVANSLLGAILFGYWPLPVFQIGLFMQSKHRGHAQVAAPRRTPAYAPGTAPDGCCAICGQRDPERLVQGWHESCVEWLGYKPFAPGGIVAPPLHVDPLLITRRGY